MAGLTFMSGSSEAFTHAAETVRRAADCVPSLPKSTTCQKAAKVAAVATGTLLALGLTFTSYSREEGFGLQSFDECAERFGHLLGIVGNLA